MLQGKQSKACEPEKGHQWKNEGRNTDEEYKNAKLQRIKSKGIKTKPK